ncbi:hypothetical protein Tco_0708080 [Tanacetum coccineum]
MVVQTSATPPTITTSPIPSTSTPTTTTTPTPTQPTPSIHPSQPQKQRVRRPTKRDTEVPQPSEPEVVADEGVQAERVTPQSNDPLSGEDRLKLNELMIMCTNLQSKVLELEQTKHCCGLSRGCIQIGGKITDIDEDADVTFVDEVEGMRDEMMFDAEKDLAREEVVVEEVAKDVDLNEDEVTLAQTLQKMKSAKGVAIREPSDTQRSKVIPKQVSKDKGKAKMVEPERPLKMKDQILFDEQEARRLQAIFDEEAQKEASNAALVEEWDNVKVMMDADYELAARLHAEEQGELTVEEKSRLFVERMDKRKKHFAAKRAEEKRSEPPKKAQKRKTMSTYLKNMTGWKLHQLKNKSYDKVQELFDQAMVRVNSFVDMDSDVLEGTSKRAGSKLEKEAKKQKTDDDDKIAKLKLLVVITPDKEEVAVDAIPLATKPPVIVDYMIYKEERTSYYKITRADGRPSEGYERVLWGDLKVMFEPYVEDAVWRELREGTMLTWKLFDSVEFT